MDQYGSLCAITVENDRQVPKRYVVDKCLEDLPQPENHCLITRRFIHLEDHKVTWKTSWIPDPPVKSVPPKTWWAILNF